MFDDGCLWSVIMYSLFYVMYSLLTARCYFGIFSLLTVIRYCLCFVVACLLSAVCGLCIGCCPMSVASWLLLVVRGLTCGVCCCSCRVVGMLLLVVCCVWLVACCYVLRCSLLFDVCL